MKQLLRRAINRVLEKVAERAAEKVVEEMYYVVRGAPDGLPVPPPQLHKLIVGEYLPISEYLTQGRFWAKRILDILSKDGNGIDNSLTILDFGCGCGRVIRHFNSMKNAHLYGTDINVEQIEWCRQNLPFANFGVNNLSPPLTYHEGQFDLVYALSVFTHLPEALQYAWRDELLRVLRPGGYLLLTTLGECYFFALNRKEQKHFRAGGAIVHGEVDASNPATYVDCDSFHPVSWVKEKLARGFEVIDFTPGGCGQERSEHDIYLLKKPENQVAALCVPVIG